MLPYNLIFLFILLRIIFLGYRLILFSLVCTDIKSCVIFPLFCIIFASFRVVFAHQTKQQVIDGSEMLQQGLQNSLESSRICYVLWGFYGPLQAFLLKGALLGENLPNSRIQKQLYVFCVSFKISEFAKPQINSNLVACRMVYSPLAKFMGVEKPFFCYCTFKTLKLYIIRKGRDIGLFISLVPKVLKQRFLIRWRNNFRCF